MRDHRHEESRRRAFGEHDVHVGVVFEASEASLAGSTDNVGSSRDGTSISVRLEVASESGGPFRACPEESHGQRDPVCYAVYPMIYK
jgi:hypothetical protein